MPPPEVPPTAPPGPAGPPPRLRWSQVEEQDPALAAAVLARFTSARHHVLAAHVAERQPPEPFQLFRLELTSVVLTDLAGDGIRVRTLRPGAGTTEVVRGGAAPA